MHTTFKNGTLTTNLPDGLKLVSKVVISKCVSDVHNGSDIIFHKKQAADIKEAHLIALKEYLDSLCV